MTDDQLELPLPGLEEPSSKLGALESAVRRTFASVAGDDGLSEADAGRLQLALELAEIIELKKRTKRTSTVSNDARLLIEILDKITGADAGLDGDVDKRLRNAMDEWAAYVEREASTS